MCNKKAYIWYSNDCLARIIIYMWLNIDILRIETVLDYFDFSVYMYNTHPDKRASAFGTYCAYCNQIFTIQGEPEKVSPYCIIITLY